LRNAEKAKKLAQERFVQLQAMIAEFASKGDLLTGTRAPEGGPVVPLAAENWQTEGVTLSARFKYCQLNPFRPFHLGATDTGLHYIFVESSSLTKLLAHQTPAPATILSSTRKGRPKVRAPMIGRISRAKSWRDWKLEVT
jgi:hypothetical protein